MRSVGPMVNGCLSKGVSDHAVCPESVFDYDCPSQTTDPFLFMTSNSSKRLVCYIASQELAKVCVIWFTFIGSYLTERLDVVPFAIE